MLPLGISAPPQRRPYLTVALLVVLVAVYGLVLLLREAPPALFCSDLTESAQALRESAGTVHGFVCRWGAIPDDLRAGRGVLTLVTATFVHVGWFHLLSNALFLAAFATAWRRTSGRRGCWRSSSAARWWRAACTCLVAPFLTDPSIGASGAVAGVLGAHLLLAPGAQVRVLIGPVPVRLPTRFVIGLWAALQLVYTALLLSRAEYGGGISYEVHVVGFLVGLVLVALALVDRPDLRRWPGPGAGAAPSADGQRPVG